MASDESKRGSSRRKGDEYQDNIALQLALELYIRRTEYQLFIDYEKVGNLDDIVVVHNNRVDAYQVKYSINPNEVYVLGDFADSRSKVYFKKFSNSYLSLKEKFPNKKLTIHLLTNRALDAELSGLISHEGYFSDESIKGKKRKRPREIREELKTITGLDEDDFQDFLSCFHFQIKQPNLDELIQRIKANLLSYELGIADPSVYRTLKGIIEDFAINRHDALIPQVLDEIFTRIEREWLLPQRFEVDRSLYVERTNSKEQLDTALLNTDGDYIVVTGLPGSGKSTFLTAYLDEREMLSNDVIVRYYCFVNINDNFQKQRLEAESLRINLLSSFQRRFHTILQGRFDSSRRNFNQILEILGKYFLENNQKLIILLDGLDHVERMEPKIQESVIDALLVDLPKGVVVVVGTQELHRWPRFLNECRESPEKHIKLPLFTLDQTEEYLIEKRNLEHLSRRQIQIIHRKGQGLPLYLWYIAKRLSETEDLDDEIERFPVLQDGDIRNYHEMLWQEFESEGRGSVKHLCGVLACLQFPVHKEDLFNFQKEIRHPDFAESFQMIKHLLREWDGIVEIFHNSFRELVLSKLDDAWVQTIHKDIADHLKALEGTDLWFSYVFEYAHKAKDYDYVIGKVNREFVDNALSHYCPNQDVENAVYWAIESAKEKSDLLALSRLGALKPRTRDRMENLDRSLLSEVLVTMGKIEDVFHYSYSSHQNQWLVDHSTALNLLEELSNQHRGLGEELLFTFDESFPELRLSRGDMICYARCLGIYDEPSERLLEWLSEIEYEPDILEPSQPFIPEYAPHLEAYIDAVVMYHPDEYWRKIKKMKVPFSNELILYFLIRSIALHKDRSILKQEIEEYIGLFYPKSNPELAFYASFAGLPPETVIGLLGDVSLPPLHVEEPLFHSDPSLNNYRMIFFALGYTGQKKLIGKIRDHLTIRESWWTSYLLYLLQAGECVGSHWVQGQNDWLNLALDSIDILIQIRRGKGERVIELVDLCRYELEESLYWLTRAVEERYPDRLEEWFEKLECLQDSKMWTTHYGINESFELQIYERLSSIPKCRKHITKHLEICEKKFKEHLYLKGSSRSDHFLMLASIAARCNSKNKAEEWLRHGIKSTLIYGNHKDITLFQLIDILEMLNKHEPDAALERCADILEMVDWMPQLTDGRETKYLPQNIFEQVAKVNTNAALCLLRIYAKNKARWKMQNCLEILIKQVQNADPEILWALTSLFANHSTEDGNHAKQVVNAKQHIIEMVEKSGGTQLFDEYRQRLDQFIKTSITPRHWPEIASNYWQPDSFTQLRDNSQLNRGGSSGLEQRTYKLEGKNITLSEIEERLHRSFEECKETLEKLEDENDGFHQYEVKDPALKHHISQASDTEDLLMIKDYFAAKNKLLNSDYYRQLGHRFIDLGDVKSGLECLEEAYTNTWDWLRWKKVQIDFKVIADHDKERAIQLLLNVSYNSMIEDRGFDIPSLIASAYDIMRDYKNLKEVYQDYLRHCQELFEHLPKQKEYEWLKDYSPETDDFNQLAIHFLVDELGTPEIDLGNRLVDACRNLCSSRPEITLPIFIERLSDADGLTKRRLLTILYAVAFENPELLISYAEKISQLLESNHFQWKMMTIKLLDILAQNGTIPEDVGNKLKSAQLHYSSTDKYSMFMPIDESPSKKFLDVLKGSFMKSMQEQIESCCEMLLISKDTILAMIEGVLKQEGWNEEEEKERSQSEWYGYIHPQGYPGILIMTTFSESVFDLFNGILDEIIGKYIFTDNQIEGLWRILQPADPEYKLSKTKSRPEDIEPLIVSDKDEWLSELGNRQNKITHRSITEEWITLFEERVLSQDKKYEVPYRSTLYIYSALVKKGLSLTPRELQEGSSCILGLLEFDDNESTTLHRARVLLAYCQGMIPTQRLPFLPILVWKVNSQLFFGYRNVVSLPNFLINQYELTFKDFDLYKDDECVVGYEVWQEGYEDEGYSRELLSYGSRLLIHSSLLKQIFRDHNVELCQCIFERRLYYKSRHEGQATEENRVDSFVIMD